MSLSFKLAIRQLKKNRAFSLLNILGLTLGLTTFLLITLYVTDELSYDKFNKKADRIVRLNTDIVLNGQPSAFAIAAPPVAATLKAHFPEVENTVRICSYSEANTGGIRFRQGDKEILEPAVAVADPSIFDIFSIDMLKGNPHTALDDKHAIVLTESAARRYFNSIDVIGKTLYRTDNNSVHTITGVIRDLPAQSSFHFDFYLSMHSDKGLDLGDSYNALQPMATFVLLKPNANRAHFDKQLDNLMRDYAKDYAEMEKDNNGQFSIRISEMPLTDVHLHSHRADELGINGDIQYVYIFSAVALFVLLIAGINFMNLSTATSANRAREVGVRKVLGSQKANLIIQFLTESLLLTTLAALLAIGITAVLLPWFNQLTAKQIALNAQVVKWLLPTWIAIIVTFGLFSGIYPAFFLANFQPVHVLKSKGAKSSKGGSLRNVLVVGQFTISIFLIVGSLVVLSQLNYIRHRDPGYNRDQVLIVQGLEGLPHPGTLKADILRFPGVTAATLSEFLPTNTHRWHNFGAPVDNPVNSQKIESWLVDPDYIPAMAMHLIKGRNFSASRGTDSAAIILNEAAALHFGIAADPLGKQVRLYGGPNPNVFTVIGIVKNFNFSSMRTTVQPLALVNRPSNGGEFDAGGNLNIRIAAGHIPNVLNEAKKAWSAFAPQRDFKYSFMDDDFDAIYRSELRQGAVVLLLTALAIFIACLGLFGLAAYAAEQRAKEIGIRKILGAETSSIIALLSKDFARLIAVAVVIATPIAWWSMHRWLENFAYRTSINPWLFPAAAGIIIVAALLTTLYQSLKAAVANPVESLRTE